MNNRGDRYSTTQNLRCAIFGHKITGHSGDVPYLKPVHQWGSVDNLGTQHVPLYGHCDRCDQDILVAKFHIFVGK